MSDHRAIKLKGTTLHTPTSYSTAVDDATYVRVVSYSTGGQNFRVSSTSNGSDIVARYAVGLRKKHSTSKKIQPLCWWWI